ncbi:helix-turn-helix domain-containing protein [Paenibacillus sp. FSL M7-1414]|uniref:helix-turn-helix domain-containing protein n=1 Tax=Paenibacillus sp. FSL M7-1414 TaxID=2921542 RepID=UPI0030F53D27
MAKILTASEMPDILSAQLIANYLGLSRSTVYSLFDVKPESGGIPNFTIGISRKVDKRDFFSWLDQKKEASNSAV